MKVLVTGGAGFIGSHIVEEILQMGYEVTVIDNLITGSESNLHSNAKFYFEDVTNTNIEKIFIKERPDYVIHQAAQTDVQYSIVEPIYDAKVNIIGLLNVLQCCIRYNVKKIICASSAAIYGEPKYLGIDEVHPFNPQSGYGITKSIISSYLKIYCNNKYIKYSVLRYSNVYGPRQGIYGEGGVVGKFINIMLQNQKPIIFGDGMQTRDFIYVKDVAKANVRALTLGNNEILNISSGGETSINDLFALIKSITNCESEVKYGTAREGDIIKSYLNNEKAKNILQWQPKWSLREGLNETIDYYTSYLNKQNVI